MAHEIDFSNDRENMAYAGDTPWHGLGQRIDPDSDLDNWRYAAGLDWNADKIQLFWKKSDGGHFDTYQLADNQFALQRSDTKAILGTCTDRYNPVQPSDVVEFYRKLCDAQGFKMETMGSLKGGKHIWGLAKTEDNVRIFGQDRVDSYVLMATSYDSTMATRIMPTTVRVVCNNTLSLAYMDDVSGITFSHLGKFDVERALDSVLYDDMAFKMFANDADELASIRITHQDAAEFLANVLFPDKELEEVAETTRSLNRLKLVTDMYNKPKGGIMRSTDNTAWGVVNAVTEFVDHNGGARNQDNRVYNAWFGRGDALKKRAINLALERFAA